MKKGNLIDYLLDMADARMELLEVVPTGACVAWAVAPIATVLWSHDYKHQDQAREAIGAERIARFQELVKRAGEPG